METTDCYNCGSQDIDWSEHSYLTGVRSDDGYTECLHGEYGTCLDCGATFSDND